MNNERRKQIKEAILQINTVSDKLDSIKDYEDEARENIPESFEYTDAYQKSEECSDALSDAVSDLQAVAAALEDIL